MACLSPLYLAAAALRGGRQSRGSRSAGSASSRRAPRRRAHVVSTSAKVPLRRARGISFTPGLLPMHGIRLRIEESVHHACSSCHAAWSAPVRNLSMPTAARSPRRDGFDHRRGTACRVPSGEHPFHRGLTRHRVCREVLALVQLHSDGSRRRRAPPVSASARWPQ